jgi:hypothetical protein
VAVELQLEVGERVGDQCHSNPTMVSNSLDYGDIGRNMLAIGYESDGITKKYIVELKRSLVTSTSLLYEQVEPEREKGMRA